MIAVENLVKDHGTLRVLDGISMTVDRGQVAAIVGPSGGGKSTLLRCINGLERFQSGQMSINGSILKADQPEPERAEALKAIRRRVGMVFQGFNLFPDRTVLGNVTEAPRQVLGLSRAEAEARAEGLLDRVGLKSKLRARPGDLSGGQQQRVAIARALAMQPEAILFDEPTSALDPRMTAEVLAVIADLARDGMTMLVVTHAMTFARRVADLVFVFGGGKVVESGPPSQIFDAPADPVTRAFLDQSTDDPGPNDPTVG